MAFTSKDVMALREKTGVGMMDCKKALQESDGDVEKAIDYLRDSADSVVVTGDDVVDIVGIAVGINDSHNRDTQLLGLGHSDLLLAGINDE